MNWWRRILMAAGQCWIFLPVLYVCSVFVHSVAAVQDYPGPVMPARSAFPASGVFEGRSAASRSTPGTLLTDSYRQTTDKAASCHAVGDNKLVRIPRKQLQTKPLVPYQPRSLIKSTEGLFQNQPHLT
ncbi:uncharacterized protein LOC129600694 [Paramacrobiotus metropolitanus]|uniref:uncharacterized protein LOC129600694 n=1 Tax=Paramacrobiotus metropolitanus TaxID=2943436 RepID=UPI002445E735|nr:uncharacterized protein LOC129600694 [Paramacrobiotus metropolitanus]